MINRKKYILPTVELFYMETEHLAVFSQIGSGEGEVGDDDGDGYVDAMSNKRRPSSPWNSSNWNSKEQ